MEENTSLEECWERLPHTKDIEFHTTTKLLNRLDEIEDSMNKIASNTRKFQEITTSKVERLEQISLKISNAFGSYCSEKGSPKSFFREMLASLSVPGMQFVGKKSRPSLHSYVWIFIHILFLIISCVYIEDEYIRWTNTPVVKTIANTLTNVNEIPLPALTICVPGGVSEEYDYIAEIEKCLACNSTNYSIDCFYIGNCTYEEKAALAMAALTCRYVFLREEGPWVAFTKYINQSIEGHEFLKLSKKIFPHYNVRIRQYRGLGEIGNVKMVVDTGGPKGINPLQFLTPLGACYTTNGLLPKDIFKDNTVISSQVNQEEFKDFDFDRVEKFTLENMKDSGDLFSYPAYIPVNGYVYFEIKSVYSNNQCLPKRFIPRYFISMHSPVDVPFLFKKDFSIGLRESKAISLVPEMIVTNKDLAGYKPKERGCYYSYERDLSMFKTYSENNCKVECAANCSLEHCGCVPYYLPRHNHSVRVCLSDCDRALDCDCDCLLDCFSLKFDFEAVRYEFHYDTYLFTFRLTYKKESFYAIIRTGLTNLAEFIAYCFGILGVFNGFSVMIIFEVMYFITFRLWHSVKLLHVQAHQITVNKV